MNRTLKFTFILQTIPTAVAVGVIMHTSVLGATIAIDARQGDVTTSPDDNLATGSRFDGFRATIISPGHMLVNVTSFTAANLAGIDALVLEQSATKSGEFSAQEISDLHAFVNGGHGLLLIGEGGWSSDMTVANLNNLAAPFGVAFAGFPGYLDGLVVNGFVPHPVTLGITTIGLDYFRRMTMITNPALDLTVGSGGSDFLAAVAGVGGSGNVVLIGDASLWSDAESRSDYPITFGSNRLLLENAIAFVTVPEPSSWALLIIGASSSFAYYRKSKRIRRTKGINDDYDQPIMVAPNKTTGANSRPQ